ncbi:MAG: DNA gyrase/topoisomerase IV subunit A [Bacteroidia bacterium]|nr:DNA gyrase/topoisomerase IV subunit A [Bacteroidia bacterium]
MSTAADSNGHAQHAEKSVTAVTGLYEDYFLDYASYVILERAVPMIEDGLKPVQRRILHAMKEMDDGRFHKVANVIGQTMQYHPHGDAAIGEALVNLGQKDLLIDTQGNWGDIRTGDSAAAPRYIEARLSKFALDIAFNPKITEWQASYDGRKKEPLALPVKFPLVLAQGVEGIAVGLATRILPHNFCELIRASIAVLKGKPVELVPDFPTGGQLDASQYNGGQRGGRIRCRARIETFDKGTLVIRDLPYGVTTESLIDSIIKANDKGKIKIKRVVDNTAQEVEILIELAPGVSPDVTIDGLYAFSDCEISIAPSACVIVDNSPVFLSVEELLRRSTHHTRELLRMELEIELAELREKLLFASLEKIFIENRIYRDIEECETWESVLETIDRGLIPFKPQFYREITRDDLIRLTEIRIKRISRFNSFEADELMRRLEEEIRQKEHHLAHLTEYAIAHFEHLLQKYGKGRERKTRIAAFDTIEVRQVAAANEKLYVNRKEGFIGYGLKKDEYVCDCSDLDDIIVFRADGKYVITQVKDKVFVGRDILHVDVWKKNDERKIYHAIYRDPQTGYNYAKRFAVTAITRDREYDVTNGEAGAKLLYFSAHPNSEAEVITVQLTQNCRAKIKVFDYDFGELAIKGRSSQGNVLTKYPVRKITRKALGAATLGGRKIWYDDSVGRLNTDERGRFLGTFDTEDRILVLYRDGSYELTNFELTNRYDFAKVLELKKLDPELVVSAVHFDGKQKEYFVKRFRIETSTLDKPFSFISEEAGSKLVIATTQPDPWVRYKAGDKGKQEEVTLSLAGFIEVKGWKAMGNRLDRRKVSGLALAEAPQAEAPADPPEVLHTGDQIEWSGQQLTLGDLG